MNQNDINRAFTEKVTELLGRGYQIYPGTMGGSQGEIAHVDLYKDDEIIRVLLDRTIGRGEKPDGVRLIVGRNTDRIRMNCFDTLGNTIWNNRLEILSKIEFCQIGENYYTDAETGKAIQEKRRALGSASRERSPKPARRFQMRGAEVRPTPAADEELQALGHYLPLTVTSAARPSASVPTSLSTTSGALRRLCASIGTIGRRIWNTPPRCSS